MIEKLLKSVMTTAILLGLTVSQTDVVHATSNSDIVFSSVKAPEDNVGTNVDNVFIFTVAFAQGASWEYEGYYIVYHLDGKPIDQFEVMTLPYTFTRNYDGIDNGTHTIKVDIEDLDGNVLASKELSIQVSGAGD